MTMNVGINLLETSGTASPSIQGAATSVAAFIVRSQRGVPGVVQQTTQFADYANFFGTYVPGAYGAYCIRGFFDNEGSVAYVTRVVATPQAFAGGTLPSGVTAAVAASLALSSGGSGGSTVLTVTAGNLGQQDPGQWGDSLSIGVTSNSDGSFNLVVQYKGSAVETWPNLKIGGTGPQDPNRINSSVSGSGYITVTVAAGATTSPAATVDSGGHATFTPLTGGADDNLDSATNAAAGGARDTAISNMLTPGQGIFDPNTTFSF